MSQHRRILIIAGEASGDRLAARVLHEAAAIAVDRSLTLDIYGIGGALCKAEGMHCYYDSKEMSVVGFQEVAKRYRFFKRVFNEMVALFDDPATRPDVLLLVDYPGFNIRLAAEAKKRKINVIYYVSPQVWAWKPSRVQKIVASVDRMLVIFPFEKEIYTNAGLDRTSFIGHPLVEIIDEEARQFLSREAFARKHDLDASKQWLPVFPGSRKEEVRRHLAIMVEAACELQAAQDLLPVVVESASLEPGIYEHLPSSVKRFRSSSDIHQLLHYSNVGILKSGTTTLEAALCGLPGVICYRTSWLTYWMAKSLIKLKYIGLANIVLGKKLYPELIQAEMTPAAIVRAITDVLVNESSFRADLAHIRSLLQSDEQSPSKKAAEFLLTT